jgi:hypothetical protein
MDVLADLKGRSTRRKQKLGPLVDQYREWIKSGSRQGSQNSAEAKTPPGDELVVRANVAANRIESGIKLLGDAGVSGSIPDCQQMHGRSRPAAAWA